MFKANASKQALLTDFTNELYRHTGFPNRFSEMGLYLGNYRKTPFGVHVDRCGVFSFPVVGQKKFRLWTTSFVKKNPDLERTFFYKKYNKSSQVILAQPGDMTYWPSSAWHIAESDGVFSATWSLGVWVDKPHSQLFSESLDVLLRKKSGMQGNSPSTIFKNLHTVAGEVTELPPAFTQSIELLQSLTSVELEENFLKSWMLHISMQGFKNIPTVGLKLSLNSRVSLLSDRAKILWQMSKLQKTLVFISFGGVLVESKKSSGLLKFIKALNAGEACLVGDFVNRADEEDIRSLQRLAEAGAFVQHIKMTQLKGDRFG